MRDARPAAVAGLFYPADHVALADSVRAHLAHAGRSATSVPAVVAPHAGHEYSGAVAGAVLGETVVPATCVVLAPNHTGRGRSPRGGAILRSRDYVTPLGRVPCDEPLAAAIHAAAGVLLADDAEAHRDEHAIEVLLPFLQVLRDDVRVVPLVLAWDDWERAAMLAGALHAAIAGRDDVLVVASSDGNHYESAEATERKDRLALTHVESLDGEGLLRRCAADGITWCGRVPVACAMAYARLRGARRARVVAWAHSGMVNGDHARVVGYAGVRLGDAAAEAA